MSDAVEWRMCAVLGRDEADRRYEIWSAYSTERYATPEEARAVVGEEKAVGEWTTWEEMGGKRVYYAGWARVIEKPVPLQPRLMEVPCE